MKSELQHLLQDCDEELNDIDKKISLLNPFDKTRIYLTQYALIKACGTLEYACKSIVADYFDHSSITQIHTYLEKTVRNNSMSATYENMCGLLKKFDEEWQKAFKDSVSKRTDGKKIISSANSLVTNRNLFAHGKPPIATFNEICGYYNDTKQLINELDAVIMNACCVAITSCCENIS